MFLSSNAYSNEYILPEICLDYVAEHNFVMTKADPRKVLQQDFSYGRQYRFDAIELQLQSAIKKLNEDLLILDDRPLSTAQNYVRNCMNDPVQCHGKITENMQAFLPLYCNHQMFKTAITDNFESITSKIENCTIKKEEFFDPPLLENRNFVQMCLKKVSDDPIEYEYKDMERELEYVEYYNTRFSNIIADGLIQSPNPDVFSFVYQKTIEEITNNLEFSSYIEETINREQFQQEMKFCPLSPSHERLGNSFVRAQNSFESNYNLRPEDIGDQEYVRKLNIAYLSEKFVGNSPADFSESDKLLWLIFRYGDIDYSVNGRVDRQGLIWHYNLNEKYGLIQPSYLPEINSQYLRIDGLDSRQDNIQSPINTHIFNDAEWAKKNKIRFNAEDFTQDEYIQALISNPDILEEAKQSSALEHQSDIHGKRYQLRKFIKNSYKKFYVETYPYISIHVGMSYFLIYLHQETLQGRAFDFPTLEIFISSFQNIVCKHHHTLCRDGFEEMYKDAFTYHYENFKNISFNPQALQKTLAHLEKEISKANTYCYENGISENSFNSLTEDEREIYRQEVEGISGEIFSHPYMQTIIGYPDAQKWLGLANRDPVYKCFRQGMIIGQPDFNEEIRDFYYRTSNRSVAVSYTIEYPDYTPKQAYIKTEFEIKTEDLLEITQVVQEKLFEKLEEVAAESLLFNRVRGSNHVTSDQYEEIVENFQDHMEFQIIPILLYFKNHQNYENGENLCEIFLDLADTIAKDERRQILWENIILAVSILAIPVSFGTSMTVSSIMFGALSLVYGGLNIHQIVKLYQRKNDTIVSMATGHFNGFESSKLYQAIDDQIHSAYLQAGFGSIMFFAFTAKPFAIHMKSVWKQSFSKSFKHAQKRRFVDMEDHLKRTDPEQVGDHFLYNPKLRKFLANPDRVETAHFKEFMHIVDGQHYNKAQDYLRKLYPALQSTRFLGPLVTRESIPKMSTRAVTFIENTGQKIKAGATDFKRLAEPIWYRFFANKKAVMFYINQRVKQITSNKILESSRFKLEEKLIEYLQKLKLIEDQTQIVFISDEKLMEIIQKMKYHTYEKGTFKPYIYSGGKKVAFSTKERFLRERILKELNIRQNVRVQLEVALNTLIRSHVFDDFDWVYLLRNFNGKIENIVDCWAFERAVKQAVNEHTNIFRQIKLSWLSKNRELLLWNYYKKRRELIIANFNDFYKVSQYAAYKEYMRKFNVARDLNNNHNIVLTDLEYVFRKRFEGSFDLSYALRRKKMLEASIEKLEKDPVIQMIIHNIESPAPPFLKRISAPSIWPRLPDKDEFLLRAFRTMKKEDDAFHTMFQKELQKYVQLTKENILKIVKESTHNARIHGMVHGECSDPNSAIRRFSNRSMDRFMITSGALTEVAAYTIVHNDEDMTSAEFWSRAGFDVSMKVLGNFIRSRVFTNTGSTPVFKISKEVRNMAFITGIIDATLYGVGEKYFWGHEDEFFNNREGFRTQMLEDIAVNPELLENPIDPINPLIKDDSKFYQEFLALYEQAKNKVDANLEKYPLVTTDDDMYKIFVQDQFLDDLKSYQNIEDELLDHYADYLYRLDKNTGVAEEETWVDDVIKFHPMMWVDEDRYDTRQWSVFNGEHNDETYDSINRWLFYRTWDMTAGAHISYWKNHLIYSLLCKHRLSPVWNTALAGGVYVLSTLGENYIKLDIREKVTDK